MSIAPSQCEFRFLCIRISKQPSEVCKSTLFLDIFLEIVMTLGVVALFHNPNSYYDPNYIFIPLGMILHAVINLTPAIVLLNRVKKNPECVFSEHRSFTDRYCWTRLIWGRILTGALGFLFGATLLVTLFELNRYNQNDRMLSALYALLGLLTFSMTFYSLTMCQSSHNMRRALEGAQTTGQENVDTAGYQAPLI